MDPQSLTELWMQKNILCFVLIYTNFIVNMPPTNYSFMIPMIGLKKGFGSYKDMFMD